jgi:ferredoxin
MTGRRPDQTTDRLLIDPTACDGVGICGHLAPELIRVDSWGYPILVQRILHRAELRVARAAVAACPRKALFIGPG